MIDVRAILEANGIVCPYDPPLMPCPECRYRHKCKRDCNQPGCRCRTICDDCAARLARVRVQAAIEQRKQGEMF